MVCKEWLLPINSIRSQASVESEEQPLCGVQKTTDSWTCLYCFALCGWQVNHRAHGGNRFIGSVLQHVNRITNGRLPSPKRDKSCSPRHPVSGTLPADKELEENIYGPCEVLMLSFKHVYKILTWELCKLYHFYQQKCLWTSFCFTFSQNGLFLP